MPDTLSPTERQILNYLADYLREHTYQPSVREIGRRFGIKSTKTVSEHLQALADKGYIERDASRSRAVRIRGLDLGDAPLRVPLYGKIAAGEPMLLREHVIDEYSIDPSLAPSADSFFLRAVGNSMEQSGILDGDLVLVEPASEIRNGEIVAARIAGDATIKRYFAHGDQVVLEPASTEYAPLLVNEHDDFVVLGRVTGLFRRLAS